MVAITGTILGPIDGDDKVPKMATMNFGTQKGTKKGAKTATIQKRGLE